MLRPVLTPLLNRIDHAVAVSPDAAALVERYLGGTFEVLFNGVDVSAGDDAQLVRDTRPSILFIGRHEERKGLGVLLEAVESLELDPHLTPICWIIGDGPESARLRQRHADPDRFRWLGRLSDTERDARLRRATVLAAPSLRGESFGIVLLEGMAAGAVVVASDIEGYRNVATDGRDALLVPPGNAAALAEAIRRVLTNDTLRMELCAAGSLRADSFSMSRLADLYIERYRQVIGAPGLPTRRA
jgi:phosphatidylinositol alpha-mannosyltransferase